MNKSYKQHSTPGPDGSAEFCVLEYAGRIWQGARTFKAIQASEKPPSCWYVAVPWARHATQKAGTAWSAVPATQSPPVFAPRLQCVEVRCEETPATTRWRRVCACAKNASTLAGWIVQKEHMVVVPWAAVRSKYREAIPAA